MQRAFDMTLKAKGQKLNRIQIVTTVANSRTKNQLFTTFDRIIEPGLRLSRSLPDAFSSWISQ